MTTPCHFDSVQMMFAGSPLDQARCLLRNVKPHGIVDEAPASLPPVLSGLLAATTTLGITKAQVRSYLQAQGIDESTVGGSVMDRICHADSDNPNAPLARYFVIHDTSFKLGAGQDFDPGFINTSAWSGNKLSSLPDGKTHIYITRLGKTLTDRDYGTPWRATQFEIKPPHTRFRGLFLHHELVQPRMGPGTQDFLSPDPGFTPAQYERLALQYVIAGVRRGEWMVPAFHCVLDLGFGDHDDPQHFDLADWDAALATILADIRAEQPAPAMAGMAAPSPAGAAGRARPTKAGKAPAAKAKKARKATKKKKAKKAKRPPVKKASAKKKATKKKSAAKSRKTKAATKKRGATSTKKSVKTSKKKSKKRA